MEKPARAGCKPPPSFAGRRPSIKRMEAEQRATSRRQASADSSQVCASAWMEEWCPGLESNQRHCDFQSHALPTELPGHPAKRAALRLVRGDIEGRARAVQPTNDPAGGKISVGPATARKPRPTLRFCRAGRDCNAVRHATSAVRSTCADKSWNQSAVVGLMRRRQRWRRAYRRSGASRGCTGGSIVREAEFGRQPSG